MESLQCAQIIKQTEAVDTLKSQRLTSCSQNSTCRHFIETCVNDFEPAAEVVGDDDRRKAMRSNRDECVLMFDKCTKPCMSSDDVQKSLNNWCNGLVELSQRLRDPDDVPGVPTKKESCESFVRSHYAFDDNLGNVLFKPTVAKGTARYRLDEQAAIDYFCGTGDGNRDDELGNGFAKKTHWKSCEAKIEGLRIDGCTATVLGSVTVSDGSEGQKTTVDKTWTLVKGGEEAHPLLQLVGHHSSLQV